jgi:hypothetical protein
MYGMIPSGPKPKPIEHILTREGTSLWKKYETYQKEMIETAKREGAVMILSDTYEVLYEQAIRR